MLHKKSFHPLGLFAFLLLFAATAGTQNLPSAMRLAESEHILYTGDQASTGLYDESQIRVFELWFPQTDYWQQLKNNYASHTDLPATLIVEGDTFPNVGVRFKGQTSYSQTQNSDKKSFNITLDYANPDQDLMGYGTINLNNCFEDASFMREVTYLHQIRRHVPAAKACYVQLYINGSNWGIYPNVQQLNRDLIREWYFSKNGTLWRADRPAGTTGGGPGWGDGTAALNDLGADTTTYKQYYTLKSTDKTTPWDDLVQVCEVLNETPLDALESTIVNYLDLDRTLWFLASEIAFSDDDSYVFKGKMDYYLYWDPETNRMTPLEFDGNSAMKSNSSNWGVFYNAQKVNYPLLNRLLAVPSIRQRYLAHMRTLVQQELDPTAFAALVDQYDALINAGVMADPKKLYTNSQYTTEKQTIKTFVTNHRTTLLNHVEMNVEVPTVGDVVTKNSAGITWVNAVENEPTTVNTYATATAGIAAVNLYYSAATYGNFTQIQMFDDGQHKDGASGDGVFGADIPGFSTGTFVRFYVEAKSANTAGTVAYAPVGAEHDVYFYRVTASFSVDRPVVINEIMASNTNTVADESGAFEDWIELFNLTNDPVDLSGYFLSDNPSNIEKWTFAEGTIIPANGYLIVWADEDGTEGSLHASFKLSASGESLSLANSNRELVDTLSFGQQISDLGYARVPNGTGPFVIQTATFGATNSTVGTIVPASENWLAIQPTITASSVDIQLTSGEIGQLRLIDMQGKTVVTIALEAANTLDMSHLPAGTYAAHVLCGDKAATRFIVKQ
jgi:hypothetical protein